MRLRQGSKRCVIPKLESTAQHSSYIQHIPTQHLHWPREPQVAEDGISQLQLRFGDFLVILDVLSTWGAEYNARACERPHPRMSGGQHGHISIRKTHEQLAVRASNFTIRPLISPGHRPIFGIFEIAAQWQLRYHCGNDQAVLVPLAANGAPSGHANVALAANGTPCGRANACKRHALKSARVRVPRGGLYVAAGTTRLQGVRRQPWD